MNKWFKSLCLLGLILIFVSACSTEKPDIGDSKEGSENLGEGKIKIGFSISTLNNPFFVNLRDGAEEAAKEAGYEIIITDAQDETSKQINDIEDLLQQDLDVLIINATDDSAIVSAVMSANDLNVPVITVDRTSEGGEIVSHIASDNILGGEMAGEFIAEQLNGEGKVVELQGIAGVLGTRWRGEGFHNIINEFDGIEIVASQNADYDRTKGLTVMENIIQGNESIDAVFAHNDEMALGALEALEANGMLEDVILVGFDATDDALAAIKEGRMSATVGQQPKLISKYAIETAGKIANGEDVEEFIPVELQLITD